jgi:bifunctional DNA-binding transcriptional regulator/antitoxin component of YhaV-PrlF toxin-antitoxin module
MRVTLPAQGIHTLVARARRLYVRGPYVRGMGEPKLKPREQGDIGELSAMEWLASRGAHIYVPVGHSPDVDLIAEIDGRMLRVEVKTSNHRNDAGRWSVHIATRGGNQSWNGVVKYFRPERCDFLFVHVGDGRRWFIPSAELSCRAGLTLGGSKYSEFEVESGRPIGDNFRSTSKLDGPEGERRSRRAGPVCKIGASVLSEFDSHLPHSPTDRHPSGKCEQTPAVVGRSRISANHQLTIPIAPFEAAGLDVGDRLRIEVEGTGRLAITRIEEFMQQHASQLQLEPNQHMPGSELGQGQDKDD